MYVKMMDSRGKWVTVNTRKSNLKFPISRRMKFTISIGTETLDEHNGLNRKIDMRKARQMAHDMENDTFPIHTNDIGFDVNGNLVDGQHRITASILANKPLEIFVKFGLDPACRDVIDIGSKRTIAHTLQVNGYDISRREVAVGNFILEQMNVRLSQLDHLAFIIDNAEALKYAVEHFNAQRLSTNVIHAVIARAFYHVNIDILDEFCHKLNTGIWEDATGGDSPIQCLRELLVRNIGTRHHGTGRLILYRKVEMALSKFLNTEVVKVIREQMVEQFVLPDEYIVRQQSVG